MAPREERARATDAILTLSGAYRKIAGASLSAATAVGVGVLVWALIAASGQGLSASEKQSYIGDNERLLDSLPRIPGSLRLNMQLLPYCTNGATIGYVTYASYRTLAQMSNQDVVDFYVRNLGDAWQNTVTNTPVEVPYSTKTLICGPSAVVYHRCHAADLPAVHLGVGRAGFPRARRRGETRA